MIIEYKTSNGKTIQVDVSDEDCPKRKCFGYHKWDHRGSGYQYTDKYYSCPERNYRGCPDNPQYKEII